MRIRDLDEKDIKVGMRVRSLVNSSNIGTIISVDPTDDNYFVVSWPTGSFGGFYGNDCDCEVVDDE